MHRDARVADLLVEHHARERRDRVVAGAAPGGKGQRFVLRGGAMVADCP
jgi:hypothetical protein